MEPCRASNCDKVATTEVFWPGQTTRQCDDHAAHAVRIGEAMGFVVETRPLPIVVDGGADAE